VQADQETIGKRLARRVKGKRQAGDLSDADWTVYKWMVEAQEPIMGEHLVLDTTATPTEELAAKLHRYWVKIEADAAIDPDLQPPSWTSRLGGAD